MKEKAGKEKSNERVNEQLSAHLIFLTVISTNFPPVVTSTSKFLKRDEPLSYQS